jgi:Spy/CpxP family protein refolding chaperone
MHARHFACVAKPAGRERPGEEGTKMHPGFMGWWHARRAGQCGVAGGHAGMHAQGWGPPWAGHGHGGGGGDEGGFDGGGGFGVRRPLRFLAYKLELDDTQVESLARVLSDLKTERAQAAVDQRRTTTTIADAIAGDAFDGAKVDTAVGDRAKTAERVGQAVRGALEKIHAILRPDQRAKLAYLLRTGALSI